MIEVGLLPEADAVSLRLDAEFTSDRGLALPAGEYRFERDGPRVRCKGPRDSVGDAIALRPADPETGRFSLEATIGVQFHWQQQEVQTFAGGVRVIPTGEGALTVINDVPLETYLTSVICSEMSATSPAGLVKAHAVVSRSWLLAQRASRREGGGAAATPSASDELIRWTDREGHPTFDVCADDHCQRYHGVGRIQAPTAYDAIGATRGQVLLFDGQVCDARYAKACGGITEDFCAAWGDEPVPYLVPLVDGSSDAMPDPPLSDERAFRRFLDTPSDAYCSCSDETILREVLTPHDLATADFFRWTERLTAGQASELVEQKLRLGLGRILALEPVERGLSGRLVRLALVGEKRRVVIGKELEIRRALSPSHLYSSAFAVDVEGSPDRPDVFVLRGAGWGHGVGLCQIGAAVMAARGIPYEEILAHYYPGTTLRHQYT
jgi:SpoIID/LytB domain protein